jgi:hypothetical protein
MGEYPVMKNAQALVDALREPQTTASLDGNSWTELISIARAESLLGSLAHRLAETEVPRQVRAILDDAIGSTDLARKQALWEADCAKRALASLDCKVILMKGTAYVAADLNAGIGRSIGDLDIMVARDDLAEVEDALLDAGWEWVKPDPYDDQYYREYMHELPPLIHRERDRMIDVHHTILPLTARPTPDAQAMLDAAVPLKSGLYVMAPADMLLHSVAHLFADGDLAGGLRNLWDINQLIRQLVREDKEFWSNLSKRSKQHQLKPYLARALRLSRKLYQTPVDHTLAGKNRLSDGVYIKRLLARDGYGRETRKITRQVFYIRSHWLRMPLMMLAKHLWTKWRMG